MTNFQQKVHPVRKYKRTAYFSKNTQQKFSNGVYQIVKKIPKGKALTYKEVAEKLGDAKLARAVGNALNKNRNPKVPCHRVIRSDGNIGGYAKGSKNKIVILGKEGTRIKNDRLIK